jgi:hypothetical protein
MNTEETHDLEVLANKLQYKAGPKAPDTEQRNNNR